MNLLSFCRVTLLTVLLALTAQGAAFKFAAQTLTVPDGFEVELVSEPSLVERPIYGSFDEEGRLYVVDSSGANDKPDKQLAEKPHRVVRLEDSNGDGKFDKSIVFADRMMFPEGCLWFGGSLYVAAPPSIWKLTDTNADGIADVRQEWHEGKTLTGCANDLHGPFLGLDGWIYWCKGASAEQRYERPGRPPLVTRAAHIFRSPPDHSDIEFVLAGGMDNPVSVTFTASGERILCGTFFITHEPGKRDGLIHAIYGGVYGKVNSSTDDHKKTGELMPILTHMGPAAPASVIRYESDAFGPAYKDSLFNCAFNLHKVSRHVLVNQGATFKTEDSDFVTSDNPDFHPTDAIEDADGSLLIVDTGGWYKICCPTSQLSKPDLLGALYRIRRTGAARSKDPRGLTLNWKGMKPAELSGLLDDPRLMVRKRAMQELALRGTVSINPLANQFKAGRSVEARRNAVWALTRIDAPGAREAVRAALKDADESVRHAALHSISLWRDAKAAEDAIRILQESNPQLQRAAAEALGRIGNKNAVKPLLAAAPEKRDRVLEHSLTYALIEINDPESTVLGLKSQRSSERCSALTALDQMDTKTLTAEQVAPWLGAADERLRQTAAWVASHHPDWGEGLAGFFRQRLAAKLNNAERGELEKQLAQFAASESIQSLMSSLAQDASTPEPITALVLRAMSQASLKTVPSSWAAAVSSSLRRSEESVLRAAVTTARVLGQAKTNAPNFATELKQLARDENRPAELRLEALAALPQGLRDPDAAMLAFLCANLDPAKPVNTRGAAASVLAKAKWQDPQLLQLIDSIKRAGPLEIGKLLDAFEQSNNEEVGLKLFTSLKESKALSSLRADAVKVVLSKYPPAVQEKGAEVLTLLNVDAKRQSARLEELLPALKNGDIRRGQVIFNSQKAACASCHKMGYLGGLVGPDLTSIGQVRTERDLLESIVYPSASFVRSYEPIIVHTKSDELYSGVLMKDAAEEILVATGPNAETRIPRSDITEMRPGTVSVMPAGLDEQLTKEELADLLAFLKATKWGPR
jgi:putative membrane-bound dehydrogenase-like protein